jgi:hypothetical protein
VQLEGLGNLKKIILNLELLLFAVPTVRNTNDDTPLSSVMVYRHLGEMHGLWKQADSGQNSTSTRLHVVTSQKALFAKLVTSHGTRFLTLYVNITDIPDRFQLHKVCDNTSITVGWRLWEKNNQIKCASYITTEN